MKSQEFNDSFWTPELRNPGTESHEVWQIGTHDRVDVHRIPKLTKNGLAQDSRQHD